VIGMMIVLVLLSWGMVVVILILVVGLVLALLQKCETMDEGGDIVAVKGVDGRPAFGGVGT